MATQTSLAVEDAAAPPALPDLVTVKDLQQKKVARTLGKGHRVIYGAACAGETMILIFRIQFLAAAARAARPDPPSLVLCFDRTLSSRIAALLRQRGVALPCRTRPQMRAFKAALRRAQIPLQGMNAQAFKHFDWQHKSVQQLTLQSANGLEFPGIFIAGLQAIPMRDEALDDAMRLLQVGMARTTQRPVLSAHGE